MIMMMTLFQCLLLSISFSQSILDGFHFISWAFSYSLFSDDRVTATRLLLLLQKTNQSSNTDDEDDLYWTKKYIFFVSVKAQ